MRRNHNFLLKTGRLELSQYQTMNRSFKTELAPNNVQATLLRKHCGTARFAFNWGLAKRKDLWESEQKSTNAIALHRDLNILKKTDFPWMYEVSKCAPQEALRDLDRAYKNFFEKRSGFPKFKSRKNPKQSFRLTGSIKVNNDRIQLPRIGSVKLKERGYLPTKTKVLSATVSFYAGRWFVSVNVQETDPQPQQLTDDIIGIDVGINHLAVCSNGMIFENPKSLRKATQQLRRASQNLSRKQKGSKNREKVRRRLSKVHYRVSNIRKDALHKVTTAIAKTKPKAVVMEKLNIKGMVKNHRLARSIMDCAWAELRRQQEYKLKWIGSQLIEADQWFPSTKLCSDCGSKKKVIGLDERTYVCEDCGSIKDRDENASQNLKQYGERILVPTGSAGFQACGETVRPNRVAKAA